jgi:hypothetical protein
MDTNHDGELDRDELMKGLEQELGVDLTAEELSVVRELMS